MIRDINRFRLIMCIFFSISFKIRTGAGGNVHIFRKNLDFMHIGVRQYFKRDELKMMDERGILC